MQSTTPTSGSLTPYAFKDFHFMPRYDLLDRGLQRQVEAVAQLDASFWHYLSTYIRCVDHQSIVLKLSFSGSPMKFENRKSCFLFRSLGVLIAISLSHGD